MPQYIAFLRAINVGGHVVKMARLRELFEALGYENVETFIASGNVIFESSNKSTSALEKKIEQHLAEELGYEVGAFIRTPQELGKIVEYQPFPAGEIKQGASLYVSFLAKAPDKATRTKVAQLKTEIDSFHVHDRELYWLCTKTISKSLVSGAQLNKVLGVPSTMRNISTLRKLAAKYSA